MINKMRQNFLSFFNPQNIMSLLLGALGAVFILLLSMQFISKPKKIVTINLTKIINKVAHEQASLKTKPPSWEDEVKSYASSIEKKLTYFAKVHHLTVFPREAIVTGAPDYTQLFLNELQQEQRSTSDFKTNDEPDIT